MRVYTKTKLLYANLGEHVCVCVCMYVCAYTCIGYIHTNIIYTYIFTSPTSLVQGMEFSSHPGIISQGAILSVHTVLFNQFLMISFRGNFLQFTLAMAQAPLLKLNIQIEIQ